MKYYSQTITTPDGPFSFITNGNEVISSGWTNNVAELSDHIKLTEKTIESEIPEVTMAVEAYYNNDFNPVTEVPLSYRKDQFIGRAQTALHKIPAGKTVNYRELAKLAGNEKAYRAAASACARNPVALFIPCHRVLRSNGELGGFLWGLDIKESLLKHEGISLKN